MRARERGAEVRWSPPAGELQDLHLQVRVAGEGSPTFLLLHGLAGSHRYFGAAFDVLAADARLVVPDLLGFGGSIHRGGTDYSADAHAAAVHESLEQLGVEPPVYVGAHSVGALVALRLARRWPDGVRGIAAFGPPLYASAEHAREHVGRLGPWVRLFAMDTAWARWICAWMCAHRSTAARLAEWLRPDLPAQIARDGVAHDWDSYSGSLRSLVLGSSGMLDLEHVEVPVELIMGERDRVVDPEVLEGLARARTNVRLERWPGDHDLPLRDPERCVATLRRLAQRA